MPPPQPDPGETDVPDLSDISDIPFEMLADAYPDVVVVSRPDRPGAVWVSPSVEDVLGWRPEEWMGLGPGEVVHPDDVARLSGELTAPAGDVTRRDEYRVRHADGSYRWVSARTSVMRSADGARRWRFEVMRDITDLVLERHRLALSERQFRLAMHGSPEGMALVALDRRIVAVNPALCRMLGRTESWFLGRSVQDLLDPADRAADRAARERLLAGDAETATEERRLQGVHRDVVVVHSVGLLREPDGEPLLFVSHFMDVTDRKAAEAELRAAATHDPLTGLVNRLGLLDEIGRSLASGRRRGRRTGVLMVDLDHFKHVNDSLGHHVGDELLRAAAERIGETVREEDVVARQGGDEFVVVMRDLAGPVDALRAAERVVDRFRRPLVVSDSELYTTASVGIAVSEGDDQIADDLLRDADTALYVAKDGGRDRVALFNEVLRASADHRLRVENELRAAVPGRDLVLWFQPEIDLSDGSIRAVEALLRWHHPSGQLLAADRFIDVAEETGLIVDIGEYVLREAFRQAARWADEHPEREIDVRFNLSALQLAEPNLIASVDEALALTGADPSRLCAEITETAMMRDLHAVRRNLVALRVRGIRIALDDFGTGYASLSYLQEFPIDRVKLDRSFIAGVAADDHHYRLVAGILALTDRLGLPVTAEGVEEEVQADILRDLGCVAAQGWLYSRAVPAGDIDAQLEMERRIH